MFLPATAPSGVGRNEYYKSDEDYFHALAAEMGKEYRAIVDAGILVQIDDPFLPDIFFEVGLDDGQKKRRAQIYVEAINAAIKGIPAERVRFHTCYGINEGPRIYEAALADIIDYVLKINAGSYSFEAANPRHEHEYHLFERVKVPEGKVLVPGVITHASNIVEHPELIAERIIRFARLVGRENVIAGADCGFSSQALYNTEVHRTVVWEKFKAMRAGADVATRTVVGLMFVGTAWLRRSGCRVSSLWALGGLLPAETYFGSDFRSSAAMRLASATSSVVLTLKNGSTGVAGHVATAMRCRIAQFSTLRTPSFSNACRKSPRMLSGHNATTGCRLCPEAAQAISAPASMRARCRRPTRSGGRNGQSPGVVTIHSISGA